MQSIKAFNSQYISSTGILPHVYHWVMSSFKGATYYLPPQEKNKISKLSIYFIHGTADRSGAFTRVADRLIEQGLPEEIFRMHLLSFEQRYQGKSIEFFAQQVVKKIKSNQDKNVIFIGHSRGGLVGAAAALLAQKEGINVWMNLSICSPFKGSYLAPLLSWLSTSVNQMRSDSAYLQSLKELILEDKKCLQRFVAVEEDAIVSTECAYLDEYVALYPDSLKIFDRHGHLSSTSSHRLVTHILNMLNQAIKQMHSFHAPVKSDDVSLASSVSELDETSDGRLVEYEEVSSGQGELLHRI